MVNIFETTQKCEVILSYCPIFWDHYSNIQMLNESNTYIRIGFCTNYSHQEVTTIKHAMLTDKGH